MAAITLGSLLVNLGLESGAFKSGLTAAEKELKTATRRMVATGKDMQDMGQRMTLGITLPFLALGKVSVDAAMESRDALAQVEASLASMGDGAGRTAEQLKALAETQMKQSLYDDDEILRKVTASMLTFGNVAGAQFDRAQQAAIDLSAKLGGDLQDSAIKIGKALNDPVKGITALGKAGIQFTAQQREMIKAMAEAGDMAGAQQMILAELEKQLGGSAAAAAKANPFARVKRDFEELKESIGEKLLPALERLAGYVDRALGAFNNLSPGMQTAVVAFAALAAAAGPLLSVIGLATQAAAPFIAAIGLIGAQGGVVLAAQSALAGLSAVLAPIAVPLAALAAAGALIYANWDKIGPVIEEFWTAAQQALGPEVRAMVAQLSATLSELWNGPLGEGVRQAVAMIGDLAVAYVKIMGPAVIAGFKLLVTTVSTAMGAITGSLQAVSRLLRGDFSGALNALVPLFNVVFGGIPEIIARMVGAVRDWLITRLTAIFDQVKIKITEVKKAFFDLYDAVVGHSYIPDMVVAIGYHMGKLQQNMVDPALDAADATGEAFRTMADATLSAFDRLAGSIKGGGFLDILSSALGMVTQLGSIGLFGSKVADRINLPRVPAYAGGTSWHPGGMALVGERGPELVNLPRGASVTPNGQFGGPMQISVEASPYFDVRVNGQIMKAAPVIAEAGGQIGHQRMASQQARTLR